jgi:hypothetical protein
LYATLLAYKPPFNSKMPLEHHRLVPCLHSPQIPPHRRVYLARLSVVSSLHSPACKCI